MTRVSNAAALTLQTWSRTVLARKEADALMHEKRMQQIKSKSMFQSQGASAEVWTRRFLMLAACVALVGVIPVSEGAGDAAAQVMATSSTNHEVASSKVFSVFARAVPSLMYSGRSA